ncbi:hypothetical protein DOY81_011015 [Sarcophaga bullata]|nr:hypothetical protein DOY81_011015 [Sarcophaga bullata]
MKNIIIVAVFCLVASAFAANVQLSDEQKAKVKEHFQACVQQENISEEDAARLRSKDFDNPSENMKCFGTCFFEKNVQLSDEQKAKVKEHFQACVAQENVSEDDAARLRSKDFANPSENMKCFSTCFFEKIGALKDGQVQEDVVLQ